MVTGTTAATAMVTGTTDANQVFKRDSGEKVQVAVTWAL